MITLTSVLRAARYEVFRLRTAASARVLVALALLAVALVTLPAAHELSTQPGGLGSARYGAIAWVVGGGRLGVILPGCVAAAAAAWFGASSIDYEYRHGTALALFASIPRRGAVLAAKALVVAVLATALELANVALAFAAAELGFVAAGVSRPLPAAAALATPPELASAAACGVLALLLTVVVRVRLVAWLGTLALAVAVTAAASTTGPSARGSADPVTAPLREMATRLLGMLQVPTGLIPARLLGLAALSGLLLLLVGAAQCAVARRRAQ